MRNSGRDRKNNKINITNQHKIKTKQDGKYLSLSYKTCKNFNKVSK